ncbi:uncharacterized protein LOC122016118 isoform X1 [Zingiber officinale]|uniref:uncharacterized protein LOC122016118 isoform X1 n=1 Tax=Zingiber officinale TaxID=94328 RepID=UPI001C4B43D1|nr:uncharacterized protein LOC122016118 isoform X1 [Zingiber officinale]
MTTTDTSELGPRGVANETPPSDSGSPFPTFPTFPTTPLSATPPGAPRPRPVRRTSRMEDLLDKVVLLLRAFAGLFSLVALIVLASNKHGDWEDFSRYQEYRPLCGSGKVLAGCFRARVRLLDGSDYQTEEPDEGWAGFGAYTIFMDRGFFWRPGDCIPAYLSILCSHSNYKSYARNSDKYLHRCISSFYQHGVLSFHSPCSIISHLWLQSLKELHMNKHP